MGLLDWPWRQVRLIAGAVSNHCLALRAVFLACTIQATLNLSLTSSTDKCAVDSLGKARPVEFYQQAKVSTLRCPLDMAAYGITEITSAVYAAEREDRPGST